MGIWKWLGEDEFVPGCPARDLTQEEAERRGILELVQISELYEFESDADEDNETEDD